MLTLDLIAAFPFALIDVLVSDFNRAWATTRIVRAMRLFKLLRGLKLPLVTNVLERYTRFNPGLLRVMRLLLILLICCHWTGCMWYYIGAVAQRDVYNEWTPTAELRGRSLIHKYLASFYWAFGLLTGIAPTNVSPETAVETLFSVLTLMGGVCISALVISSATSAVANLDAYAEMHQTELDAINGYLRFKRVPLDLRRRINNFHNYIWSSMQYMDQNSAISGLPPQLRLQLLLALNLRCLAGVPIFKHCDTRVIIIVVQSMKSAVFCPDEFVVRQGTYGKALFLIARGTVQVLDKNAKVDVLATLSDNDFFGEMSLVTHEKTNASIRSVHYSDMNVLLRSDFLQIVELFPELAKVVSKIRDSLHKEEARKLAGGGAGQAKPGASIRPRLKAVRLATAASTSLEKKRCRVENAVKSRCSTIGSGGVLTNSSSLQGLRRMTRAGGGSAAACAQRRATRATCSGRDTTKVPRDVTGEGGLDDGGGDGNSSAGANGAAPQEQPQPGCVLGHPTLRSSGSSGGNNRSCAASNHGNCVERVIQEVDEEDEGGQHQMRQ